MQRGVHGAWLSMTECTCRLRQYLIHTEGFVAGFRPQHRADAKQRRDARGDQPGPRYDEALACAGPSSASEAAAACNQGLVPRGLMWCRPRSAALCVASWANMLLVHILRRPMLACPPGDDDVGRVGAVFQQRQDSLGKQEVGHGVCVEPICDL